MPNTTPTLPQTVLINSLSSPICETNFNVSVYYSDGAGFAFRLYKVPPRSPAGSGKGLHGIQELLPMEWYNVQRTCPYIGQADFSSVRDMIDLDTGAPTVALVSPYYEKGNVLGQENATKEQKRAWALQICKAVDHLHKNDIIHANIHPRNILIQNDGSAVLTDACLYSLTVEHVIIPGLSPDIQENIGIPKTIACRTAAAVMEYGGMVPASAATKYDDIFGLGVSIYMIFEGRELWSERQAVIKIPKLAHRELQKPVAMDPGLWQVLQALFSREGANVPSIQDIMQEL